MTLLVRNRSGGVHVYSCKLAGRTAAPWVWAEGRDPEEWIAIPWLRPCARCLPEVVARGKWGSPVMVTQDEYDLIGKLGA